VEIARAELPIGPRPRWPVGVQGADGAVAEPQVAIAPGVVAGGGLVGVDPLVGARLAPELHIALVVSVGDEVVVAELMPGVGRAIELALVSLGGRRRVDRIVV